MFDVIVICAGFSVVCDVGLVSKGKSNLNYTEKSSLLTITLKRLFQLKTEKQTRLEMDLQTPVCIENIFIQREK